jgi:hypothetical protein
MERTLLSSLPEELISNIACKLGSDDIFAFRSTCHAIQIKSFHEFATEYFSEKGVHFTTDSLQALVGISASRLAKYVKSLSVVTAMFDNQGFSCPGRSSTHWRPTVRQSEAYKFYMRDQTDLHKTHNDMKFLAQALRSLPSLKNISVLDTPALLSPSTDYRGGNKVFRQTGTHPINGRDSMARIQSKEFQAHLQHLWFTVLISLASADGSQLKLEEFNTNFCTDANFLTPKHFGVKPAMLTRLAGPFQSVSRLHLHLRTPEDNKRTKDMFARFTATLPNLKELTLDFDTKSHASGLLFRRFTAGIDFSKLTSLNVVGLSIDAARLTKSISQLTQVKDLRLYCVEVTPGSWPTVLVAIKKLEKLDHLHLQYLRESGCKSYFLKQHDTAPFDDPDELDAGFFAAEEWDDEDDNSDVYDYSDGGMPGLQPVGDDWAAETTTSDNATAATTAPTATDAAQVDEDVMSEYVPYHAIDGGERGFYICVSGHEKITKRLVTFIEEYNVGEYMDPTEDLMGAMGAFPGGGAMGVGAIPVGGGMAIPIAVGTGPPPPGAIVGQTAGGFGAFMNAMGLVGLGPLPGVAAHGHHHPPPFTAGAAAAAATPATPAAANGGTANNGAAPAAPAVTPTFDDGGFGVDFDDDGGAPVDEMD